MTQIDFSDKSNGDYLTPQDVNDIKSAINTNEGLLSNGNVSGYYDSNNHFRYNHHLIPESNSDFDLGSAEYKVRHLFLSDNSLWVGDQSKISVRDNGELVFSQIKKDNVIPGEVFGIAEENNVGYGDLLTQLITDNGYSQISEITTEDYLNFLRQFNPDATIDDLYPGEGSLKYRRDNWGEVNSLNKRKDLGYKSFFLSATNNGYDFRADLTNNNKFFLNLLGKYTTGTFEADYHQIEIDCHINQGDRGYDVEFLLYGVDQLPGDPNLKFSLDTTPFSRVDFSHNAEDVDQYIESVSGDRASSEFAIVKCKILRADIGRHFIAHDYIGVSNNVSFDTAFNKKGDKFRCGDWSMDDSSYGQVIVSKDSDTNSPNFGYVKMDIWEASQNPIDELPSKIFPDLVDVYFTDNEGYVSSFSFAQTKTIAICDIQYLSNYTDVTSSKSF